MAKKNGPPQIGEKIPSFKIPSTAGSDFSLVDFKGKKIVLYFYPKDATPGCTLEGHEFSKLKPQFKKLNAEVFGISRDSMASHQKFKDKQCYTVDLLADEDEAVCKIFDVVQPKNMYGKMVRGIVRSTFVVDENGCLEFEWRKVKAEGHAQAVLDALKAAK